VVSRHRELGYPLAVGGAIALVVGREFTATLSRSSPSLRTCAVGPDAAQGRPQHLGARRSLTGNRAPVTATFQRPLDHARHAHCITITGPQRTAFAGTADR
jgi:hypothetical protein